MPNLFILAKDCNPQVGNTGKVEIEWCASGSDGNKALGVTEVDFLKSGALMTTVIIDAAKAGYAAAYGVTFAPADIIKLWGSIV